MIAKLKSFLSKGSTGTIVEQKPLEISTIEIARLMHSLREDHRFKILQSLWHKERNQIIAKGKECKDGVEALRIWAEVKGMDAAINTAFRYAQAISEQDARKRMQEKIAGIVNPTAGKE